MEWSHGLAAFGAVASWALDFFCLDRGGRHRLCSVFTAKVEGEGEGQAQQRLKGIA